MKVTFRAPGANNRVGSGKKSDGSGRERGGGGTDYAEHADTGLSEDAAPKLSIFIYRCRALAQEALFSEVVLATNMEITTTYILMGPCQSGQPQGPQPQ